MHRGRQIRRVPHVRAVALLVVVVLLCAPSLAVGHHACHKCSHEPCAVCWYAKAPLGSPEAVPSLPSITIRHTLALPPTWQPLSRPLPTPTARAPPLELL